MLGAILIIGFLIVCGAAGYYLFTFVFDLFFGKHLKDDHTPPTYIDKSVHHHYHDSRTLNITDKDNNLHSISRKSSKSYTEPKKP